MVSYLRREIIYIFSAYLKAYGIESQKPES